MGDFACWRRKIGVVLRRRRNEKPTIFFSVVAKAEARKRRWSARLSGCGKAKTVRFAQGAERPKGGTFRPPRGAIVKT